MNRWAWDCIQKGMLLLVIVLGLYVAGNLYQGEAVEVPEAKMMADWRELERLAREYPYQEQQGHGSR
jgi:hypothetical protein